MTENLLIPYKQKFRIHSYVLDRIYFVVISIERIQRKDY